MISNQCLRNTRLTLFITTAVQSVWASRAHREAKTLKLLCAVCQHASRATPLRGLSLTWSASVNSTPWRQSAMSTRAPAVSLLQTTAWFPAPQHRRARITPTAARGTPAAHQEDPGLTCQTACRSSNLLKVCFSIPL